MKNNICIIIPYYGGWPSYFKLFLKSCSFNTGVVDYLFFTDITPPNEYPSNVHFQKLSLNDFNHLASRKLDLAINVTSPYKLCDFRPAYGLIFSEFLQEYNYWGHGDEDVILGDVSGILGSVIESDFDVISLREEWTSGSFCLYKNNHKVNVLFQSSISYPAVFLTNEHQAFDECFKLWKPLQEGRNLLEIDLKQSMSYLIKKRSQEGVLKSYFNSCIKESIPANGYMLFDNGHVYFNGEKEFIAYHYISEKKSPVFTYPNWESIPDKFYINNTGFFTEDEWNNDSIKEQIIRKRRRKGKVKELKNLYQRIVKKFFS